MNPTPRPLRTNTGRSSSQLLLAADTLLTLPYDTWNFGDSVAFEGLVEASRRTGDEKYLYFAQGFVRAWATRAEPFRRRDCTAPGAAMVELYRITSDLQILDAATALADYLLQRPRLASGLFATWAHSPLMEPYGGEETDPETAGWLLNPPAGAFIDCLHFDPPFFTALGRELHRADLIDAGLDQANAYVRRLQQPSGLFHHFELDGVTRTFGAGWGRGQGWALLGLLDVIDNIGPDDPRASPILRSAQDLTAAMVSRQHPSGHWGIDVTGPVTGDEEYSTAAFMAVGFSRMLRRGLLPEDLEESTRVAARKARHAVLSSLRPDHSLPVSVAVMASTQDSHYVHVPNGYTTPWGQGPLVLMLAEDPA